MYEAATQRIVNVEIGEAILRWLAGGERDPFEEVPLMVAEHPQYRCWRGKQTSRFDNLEVNSGGQVVLCPYLEGESAKAKKKRLSLVREMWLKCNEIYPFESRREGVLREFGRACKEMESSREDVPQKDTDPITDIDLLEIQEREESKARKRKHIVEMEQEINEYDHILKEQMRLSKAFKKLLGFESKPMDLCQKYVSDVLQVLSVIMQEKTSDPKGKTTISLAGESVSTTTSALIIRAHMEELAKTELGLA